MRGAVEGSRREPSDEAEIVPWAQEGCERAVSWASLSPLLSSRLEGGRGPSWAQLPQHVFVFFRVVLVPRLGCP